MSPIRHADMEVVRERLQEEYKVFCQQLKFIEPSTQYFTLLADRFTGRPVLRGYFLDLINRYIESENNSEVKLPKVVKTTILPFVSEVLMTIMYYDNQILDRKAGVVTDEKRNHNLLQSKILLAELYHYIETRITDEMLAYQVSKLVREVYELVCIGQEVEIKYNHYESWENNDFSIKGYRNLPYNEVVLEQIRKSISEEINLPPEKNEFINSHSRRIYLTNACLFSCFTKFLIDRSSLSENIKQDIFDFAGLAGIVFQMVNDITDLVPSEKNTGTKTKSGNDAFSDFKNRNVTLPLALHLCSKYAEYAINLLETKSSIPKQCFFFNDTELCNDMLASGSIKTSRHTASEIKRGMLLLLNEKNSEFVLLKDCMAVASHNRFYGTLDKINTGRRFNPFVISSKNRFKSEIQLLLNKRTKHRIGGTGYPIGRRANIADVA